MVFSLLFNIIAFCPYKEHFISFQQHLQLDHLFLSHVHLISICHWVSHLAFLLPPSFQQRGQQREWDVGCMVIELVLIGLQRGLWEPGNGSSNTDCVSHTTFCRKTSMQHSERFSKKTNKKKTKSEHYGGCWFFFFSFGKCKHTLAHFVLCCLLRWEAFLQHWLDHLSDWVHHLSRPDCHISLWCCLWRLSCHVSVLGERGTDVEIFAKEEAVIALSACRHCAHTQLSYAPSPATLPTERYFKIKESVVRLSWGAASLSLHVRMYL